MKVASHTINAAKTILPWNKKRKKHQNVGNSLYSWTTSILLDFFAFAFCFPTQQCQHDRGQIPGQNK